MTREVALLIFVGIALALLALGVWAWIRRTRRDSSLTAPVGELPAGTPTVATFDGFYVATTRHGEPLERLAIKGLGFRSRLDVTVTTAGVALDLTGAPRMFIPVTRIDSVGQSTVAIDRVVEKNGLVRLSWRIAEDTIVDSYFRPQEDPAKALADAIAGILPASVPPTPTTSTGYDA